MSQGPIIAVDFDGTIVEHRYPLIGEPVPGALKWLWTFQKAGARLILWTMRDGLELVEAVDYLKGAGIELFGINLNPEQSWSSSRKQYANAYIDDAAIGTPLMGGKGGNRPYVDWTQVGPMTMHRCWPLMQVARARE